MKAAMMTEGKDVLGYQTSLKEISDHIWGLIAQSKLLQQKKQNESNSTSFYRDYIKKDRQVKCSTQKDKCEWFDREAQEAEDAAARNALPRKSRAAQRQDPGRSRLKMDI